MPTPGPHQVLVEVGSVGVCGSDVHYYRHGRIGHFVVRSPLVLGHEAGGRVVAVGEGVPSSRIGERVSLEPGVPCRRCVQCRTGRYNLCPRMQFFATPPVDGAFAEYVAHDADFAYPVPDSVSDDAAALIEPLSVGVWACRTAGVSVGSRLLIAGAGPIGLVTAQAARSFGAVDVVVSDVDAHRLKIARRFGATHTTDASAFTDLAPDVFIDCSGAPSAVQAGIRALRPAGRAVLVGMGADEVALPVSVIQSRELSITGTFRYANTWPTAIGLVTSGQVDLDGMVTSHTDLDHVVDALEAGTRPGSIKAVVRPGEGRQRTSRQ